MKMNKNNFRQRLSFGAALSAIALSAPGLALAQEPLETATQDEAQTGPVETIQVTGSRILRDPNLASPVPVQAVSSADLQRAGEPNIANVLNKLPSLLTSVSANDIRSSTSGANQLNLRGLGANRTLTLVNGRRHVGGFEGSSAVDIGSIPSALIERVEVLTGGASAVYGSDAVTGVVNFILRDDFEGVNIDTRLGTSSRWDAETANFQITAGHNFHQNRGNITVSLDARQEAKLLTGDRPWSRDNGVARQLANPALRFQQGDLSASSTPNLFQFYDFSSTGRYSYGLSIPSAAAFIAAYEAEFGTTPSLTAAETALFDRAANAPTRAILRQPTFAISNGPGIISPGNFLSNPDLDFNNNGIPDCLESFVGWNNSLDVNGSFGLVGGCWTVNDDGTIRPYQDGLVSSDFDQFGGDGVPDRYNRDYMIPRTEQITLNVNGRYDLTPSVRAFAEVKYSLGNSDYQVIQNGFFDLLYGSPDNPFLPPQLRETAQNTGGLYITRDPTDSGGAQVLTEREVVRVVGGFEGEFANGWSWEIAANYGEFTNTTQSNEVILDRYFAAIDVVTNPATGQPVCRTDLDPSVPPTTPFGIPEFDPGIYSFTPGDGQCRPANIWGGQFATSQEAQNFFTQRVTETITLKQTVFSGVLVGDTADFLTLPAGPIGFAVGGEYRTEDAQSISDPWLRGELPAGSPFGEGTLISDVSNNNSLGFNALFVYQDNKASYNVADAYAEISVPILADQFLAQELTFDAAYRVADYSTIGTAGTWKLGLIWTPIDDISFRATQSQAIRAPNLRELFITNPSTFRPIDPCNVAEIQNAEDPAVREANCRAGGDADGNILPPLPPGYNDPLSARFGGVLGGNPDLTEETADTFTVGFVFTPTFLPGLSLTVDYWDVTIKDGISAVTAQEIVENCYDATDFPNNVFCTLFTRETNTGSAQFGGFRFLNQTFVNFASIESSGIDFAAAYRFSLGQNDFSLSLVGSKQEALDFFTSQSDPDAVDPALRELRRPEWSGSASVGWTRGPVNLGWTTQYQSEQALRGVEIENIDNLFGPAGMAGEIFIHNFNASYEFSDSVRFYGGVNNVEDKQPFITETAWPVGPRGRFFFVGLDMSF
jgi:iron complex outermembrane recepter protein